MKRFKTDYPGVFFRETSRIGGKGIEKCFYIVFKKDGKIYEEKVGRQFADDMTPARAARIRAERIENKRQSRKEVREQLKTKKDTDIEKWTIGRLWDAYKTNNPDLKGIRTYESAWNLHIKPIFADKEPKDLLPLDIHQIKNRLLKERSPQTVQHVLEQLRRIINFGVNNRLCQGIDFKIEMPKFDNKKTEDLTSEQLNNLLKAIDEDIHPHAGPMMKMALFTGMRRSELFKLQWKHLDFDRNFISLIDPKGGPDQKIPMNEYARAVLEALPKGESPYVFPGSTGGRRVNIRQQVNRIKTAAGLPKDFRPLHGLRHTYASILASSGQVDMYTLQKLLTHKSPQMTQRYAHLRDETLKRASDLIVDLIPSKKTEPPDQTE
jgi:integrase